MPRLKETVQTTRKTRLWKYLLPAVAAVLAVGFAVVPRPAPQPSYRRFTSPAFPDGVRYTLLYPSTLDDLSLHSFPANNQEKDLQFLQVSKKERRLPGMSLWHRWFRPGFKPESEFILVSVDKSTVKPLKSSRLEKQGARNSVEIRHIVEVDDPRAREHFTFIHLDDFGTASYTQDDRAVAGSFRVLLPGEPVPTP